MPTGFGYKCAWIATKTNAPLAVATALGLRNVRESAWDDGLKAAIERSPESHLAFITPAIDGWVLCVSTAFFSKMEKGGRELMLFLAALSRQLGTTVQCFMTHRVIESHVWGWANKGNVARLYGFSGERGETLFDIGGRTDAEVSLGFSFFDERSTEASDPSIDCWGREDMTFPDEGHVLQLAGMWSIDPTTLDERDLKVTDGWLGETGQ